MSTRWERIARAGAGERYAATYAERFRELAARGEDIHGEATFVTRLVPGTFSVLDAGCGTGRIAIRLAELGHDVVGVDVDATMLAVAEAEAPALDWRRADLATLDLGRRFDVVLLAGNILPLLEPGTLEPVCQRLAAHVAPGGRVVCGFGLDEDHLPAGCPVTPLAEVEAAMSRAGLVAEARYSGWDGSHSDQDLDVDGAGTAGYVVTVHRGVPLGGEVRDDAAGTGGDPAAAGDVGED